MSSSQRSLRSRLVAAGASLAVALVGVMATAPAFAADPVRGNVTDQRGSITIHKHEPVNPSPPTTPDGKGAVTGAPLEGVVFVARKLNLDLLRNPGDWAKLPKADALTAACGRDGSTPTLTSPALTGPSIDFPATNQQGVATKRDLAVGAYLVCEKTTAPGKTTINKSAPFVVTVPFPDAAASKGWLYDVHVYPKNTVVEKPVKSVVVDGAKGIGTTSSLTYTIETKIPRLAADESFSYFHVIDPLLPQVSEMNVTTVVAGAETLRVGLHYSPSLQTSPNGQNREMHLVLTQTGMKLLKDAHAGEKLVVTVASKLSSLPQAGQAPNTAYVFLDTQRSGEPPHTPQPPNPPSDTPNTPPTSPNGEPGTPSNTVLTGWGKYTINKTANNPSKAPLSGAKFEVYLAATQNDACDSRMTTGTALSVNGGAEVVSQNGVVTVEGLFVGQESGTDVEALKRSLAAKHKCYVLKEIEAPAGYVTPQGDLALTPIKVTVGDPGTGKNTTSITNSQITVPQLPLTGANGQVIMSIVGISMILLASGGFLYSRSGLARARK